MPERPRNMLFAMYTAGTLGSVLKFCLGRPSSHTGEERCFPPKGGRTNRDDDSNGIGATSDSFPHTF